MTRLGAVVDFKMHIKYLYIIDNKKRRAHKLANGYATDNKYYWSDIVKTEMDDSNITAGGGEKFVQ
jgi:predicted transposase YbfD/YdcC